MATPSSATPRSTACAARLQSVGPFTWTRTPAGQHGNVFVDSTFIHLDKPLPWTVSACKSAGTKSSGVFARLPKNGPSRRRQRQLPQRRNGADQLRDAPCSGGRRGAPSKARPISIHRTSASSKHNTTDLSSRPIDMTKRPPPPPPHRPRADETGRRCGGGGKKKKKKKKSRTARIPNSFWAGNLDTST